MAKKIVILDDERLYRAFQAYFDLVDGYELIVIDLDRKPNEDIVDKVLDHKADFLLFEAVFFKREDSACLIEEIVKRQPNLFIISYTSSLNQPKRGRIKELLDKGIIRALDKPQGPDGVITFIERGL